MIRIPTTHKPTPTYKIFPICEKELKNTAKAPKNPAPDTITPGIPYSEICFRDTMILRIPSIAIAAEIKGIIYGDGKWNAFPIVSKSTIAIPPSDTSIPVCINADKKNPLIIE